MREGEAATRQRQPEAVPHFRTAIDLRPRWADTHSSLGLALREQGRIAESIDAFRDAVACDPKDAKLQASLGFTLVEVGEYREAKVVLKRSHDLLPQDHPNRAMVQRRLADCDRLSALADRLPAVLEGKDKPADAAERAAFAEVCLARGLHLESVKFYAESLRERRSSPRLTAARRPSRDPGRVQSAAGVRHS